MSWPLYGILGLVVAFLISMPLLLQRLRERELHQAGLDHPDRIDDEEFMRHMSGLLRALGYRVLRAEESDPYDLLLTDGLGQKRAALIRHWRKSVDEPVVREFARTAVEAGPGAPLIVTIERFTYKATEAAKETGMMLWALPDLARAISQVKSTMEPMPALPSRRVAATAAQQEPEEQEESPAMTLLKQMQGEEASAAAGAMGVPKPTPRKRPVRMRRGERSLASGETPFCPRCGRKMEIRKQGNQEFWACPQFPRCLGSRRKD